jgi:hypothetical protein
MFAFTNPTRAWYSALRHRARFSLPKGKSRRGCRRYVFAVTGAAILSVLLVAGCGSSTSNTSSAGHLMQQYPWLAPLGLSFIQGLLEQYGTNLVGLLIAAAAALLG